MDTLYTIIEPKPYYVICNKDGEFYSAFQNGDLLFERKLTKAWQFNSYDVARRYKNHFKTVHHLMEDCKIVKVLPLNK